MLTAILRVILTLLSMSLSKSRPRNARLGNIWLDIRFIEAPIHCNAAWAQKSLSAPLTSSAECTLCTCAQAVVTYVPLHLYESVFDFQQLSSGLVTLLLPLPDALWFLPSSRGWAVHHALLFFPLTKSLVVLLYLMEVERVQDGLASQIWMQRSVFYVFGVRVEECALFWVPGGAAG